MNAPSPFGRMPSVPTWLIVIQHYFIMRSRFTFFSCVLLGLALMGFSSMSAQSPVQAIIANGGVFSSDNHVTFAAWNQNNGNYFLFDSVAASSVQDVLVHGNHAYIAADSFVLKYDIDTYTRLAQASVSGARKLALYQDYLVVTRGFGANSDYIKVLRNDDLSEVASLSGANDECEGVVVVGDSAYVTMPGNFTSTVGSMHVVDLTGPSLARTIFLDSLAAGIGRIYHHDNKLYSLNSIAFGSSFGVVTEYDISSGTWTHNILQQSVGGGAGIHNGYLYGNFGGDFGAFDLVQNASFAVVPGGWAAAKIDTVRNRFLLTKTDYFSYGSIHRFDGSSNPIDTLAIGISPEAFDLDYRTSVSARAPLTEDIFIEAYPNPVVDRLTVDLSRLRMPASLVRVTDLQGRTLLQQTVRGQQEEIDFSFLPQGQYLVRVSTSKGDYAKVILK